MHIQISWIRILKSPLQSGVRFRYFLSSATAFQKAS